MSANQDQQRLLAILEYWHKIEFFIPYSLDQYLAEHDEWQSKHLSLKALEHAARSPWMGIEIPAGQELTGFELYLGVFDKSEIVKLSRTLIEPATQGPDSTFEYEEESRLELQGLSCFARIDVDPAGRLLLETLSLSTAPWAVGQTYRHGLEALSHDRFENARIELGILLDNFMAERVGHAGSGLTAAEVIALQALMCNWAQFWPETEQPIATLVARTKELKKPKPAEVGAKPEAPSPAPVPVPLAEADDNDDGDAVEKSSILNSFYIRDIELAMESARAGHVPETLRQFLLPLADDQRIDLYTPAGRAALYQALQPRHLNPGHWLADSGHAMSLMQQFALNQSRQTLEHDGVFAINGPPGTGKTTLLRDLFADNIVRRARVLAGLDHVDQAFCSEALPVRFKSGQFKVWPLIEALTGFEMVVASTNNAAVENISVDLIKRKALGPQWQHVRYLESVAINFCATVNKGIFSYAKGDDRPWGLISCALGKKKNRERFVQRLFIDVMAPQPSAASTRANPVAPNPPPKTLWRLLDGPATGLFSAAREAFNNADDAVSHALQERQRLAELLSLVGDGSSAEILETVVLAAERAQEEQAAASAKSAAHTILEQAAEQQLQHLQTQLLLLDRTRPSLWARLWQRAQSRAFREACKQNALNQLEVVGRLNELAIQRNIHLETEQSANRTLASRNSELIRHQGEWQAMSQECESLQARLGVPVLPHSLDELEKPSFQKDGIWHDPALAQLRAGLFAAALALQEAWVLEAGKSGKLRSNLGAVSRLVNNQAPEVEAHRLAIWQSLFMIVPIVSSTFASFATQFRGLGPEALGWLFIDEAGQAPPQAAVGALWRAKRCVVVGDPLQIEPVFTLPSPLIDALGKVSLGDCADHYAPHLVSVQRLADQANRFGAYAKFLENSLWIGSPLRVHRRCIEPMFSLANRIAYDGKMVYGSESVKEPDPLLIDLPSGWVDIRGCVSRKQVVPQQIEFMTKVIVSLFQRDGRLPDLYVISPFKAIRNALLDSLDLADWGGQRPSNLKKWWVRIGTVHTFQGKEESTVFMVLGTDPDNSGGALWASSRPNLLNVAATRAQHRFYLVGDAQLWGEQTYFREVLSAELAIPIMKREAFGIIRKKTTA